MVVNVQGDLPTIDPAAIKAALGPLKDKDVDIATLAAVIKTDAERTNPNVVKAIGDEVAPGRLRARTFTRADATGAGPHYHHIGLYAYRRATLEKFVKLPQSENEKREKLEQLRALDNGMRIDIAIVDAVPLGVDTPDDLDRARALLRPALDRSASEREPCAYVCRRKKARRLVKFKCTTAARIHSSGAMSPRL